MLDHGPDRPNQQARSQDILKELASVEGWVHRAGGGERVPDLGPVDAPVRKREFGVETLTVSGMHTLVGVTARPTADHPFPASPGAAETVVLGSVVRALLDLAGYEAGTAHTVVVLTGRGARVIACTGPFDEAGAGTGGADG
ncbi:hypothetical protein ACFRCW_44890 [Streptomyces sp. NPDC056653]|uniref:hypothetical protein n=1 Tax=Streptomyces sp. NPDC056653 TaxID=3345894 RepID=UPI0036A023CA